MKKKTLLLVVLLLSISAYGQITFQKISGTSDYEQPACFRKTSDGGYIIAGLKGNSNSQWAYLVKIDSNGNMIWAKSLGGNPIYSSRACSVQQTNDNGFIVCGYTQSFGSGGDDVYLIKTDSLGIVIWSKAIGGFNHDEGYAIQQTTDDGYIIIGQTRSFGAGNYDVYLVKTDSTGNLIWSKTFGGSNWDVGYSGQQTADGGYIITGNTNSFGSSGGALYLLKTDGNGNLLWSETFGGTALGNENGRFVYQTSDGGYIITGETSNYGAGGYDVFLIKTDSSGNTLWGRTYGGIYTDLGMMVQPTNDAGFIITGTSTSFGAGMTDVYLLKTDSTGNLLWSKAIGGLYNDFGVSIAQTNDGGYFAGSFTDSFNFKDDIYEIKTDSNGNIECNETDAETIVSIITPQSLTATTIETTPTTNLIAANTLQFNGGTLITLCSVGVNETENYFNATLSPNPFTTTATISFSKEVHNATFTLWNLLGEKVAETSGISGESFRINAETLGSGVYVYEVTEKEKRIARGKAVVY